MSNAKFKFPAATYYQQSTTMHNALTSFVDDMDLNLFDVIRSNIGSLSYKDQGIVNRPAVQGETKQRQLVNSFVKKWNSMKSEQAQNPMYGVVEVDKKYARTFNQLATGEQQRKITEKQANFEREVMTNIFGDGALVDEMINMMQEVGDSDFYSRLQQATSLSTFLEDFTKRFDEFAKKHPDKAEKLLTQLKGNEKLNELVERVGKSDFFTKLQNSPGLKKVGKFSKWMSRAKNIVNGKFVRTGVSFGKKYLKGPWGTVVNSGFHAYDNFTSDVVQQDYADGKYARATAKGVAGTALDTISDIGPIDGIIGGAMVGGLPGAIVGGGLGLVNQGVQFFVPDAYDKAKEFANNGIDWTADTATKTWNATKEFGKNAWDKANEIKDSIGQGVQTRLNNIKETANSIKEGAEKLVDTVGKGVELVKKGKEFWDNIKTPSIPSLPSIFS